jgi:hypothetical protein
MTLIFLHICVSLFTMATFSTSLGSLSPKLPVSLFCDSQLSPLSKISRSAQCKRLPDLSLALNLLLSTCLQLPDNYLHWSDTPQVPQIQHAQKWTPLPKLVLLLNHLFLIKRWSVPPPRACPKIWVIIDLFIILYYSFSESSEILDSSPPSQNTAITLVLITIDFYHHPNLKWFLLPPPTLKMPSC